MENLGHITIRISGLTSSGKLNPKDFDINEVKELINDFESLVFPSKQEKDIRPRVSYEIVEGSVNNVFHLPLANAIMFSALMSAVGESGKVDILEKRQADIIAKWQKKAYKTGRTFELNSSTSEKPLLVINQETEFVNSQNEWVDTSLNLYGKIYEEGGRKQINLHIDTDRYGPLTVDATEEQLLAGENKLFKVYGIWVKGKQNVVTGDLKDLKLIEFIPYQPNYDDLVLEKLIKKSSESWAKIKDKDQWMLEVRGGENG